MAFRRFREWFRASHSPASRRRRIGALMIGVAAVGSVGFWALQRQIRPLGEPPAPLVPLAARPESYERVRDAIRGARSLHWTMRVTDMIVDNEPAPDILRESWYHSAPPSWITRSSESSPEQIGRAHV